MVVAGHFEVTETVDFRFAARTGKFHRALPITGSDFRVAGNLLLRKFCFCVECESEFGHGNAPLNRIGRASGGTFPSGALRLQKKFRGAQVHGLSGNIDVRSRGKGIDGAILAAENEEHQLRLVLELDAEPIPTRLVRAELVSEKFVVHPGESGDRKLLSLKNDGSGCGEARLRKIVACATRAFSLLADSIFAVDDGSFFRCESEVELKFVTLCGQMLCAVILPSGEPISVPNSSFLFAHTGNSGTASIDAFGVIKAAAVEVAQSQVGQIDVADIPCAAPRFVAADGLPEKSQLKTEGPAVGGLHVAGCVPPLGLKFRTSEKIAWKFIAIAGQRDTLGRVNGREDREKERSAEGSTLHERPRRD